ncbi:NYN domain-containing protein [candidate division WOR-3 bacterium]|nr:NYN domain-containing protein [candidate division WOR-3 bacterium]
MIHYILDGYNILHALIHTLPYFYTKNFKNLQKERGKLVKYIQTEKPQGRNKVTVVFDGDPDVLDYPQKTYSARLPFVGQVEVIFAHTMSADDYIVRLIEKSENPKIIIVVTSDNGLRERVKLLNAKVLGIKAFFKIPVRHLAGREHKPKRWKSTKAPLLYEDAKEIEDELKKLYGEPEATD